MHGNAVKDLHTNLARRIRVACRAIGRAGLSHAYGHCSARLERFLLLTAEDNVLVTQPSTPAQYFHLLRRQVKSKWSKPLIVLTPKSLLRHPLCVSPIEQFTNGEFRKILPDDRPAGSPTARVILSTGKAYFDLFEERKRLDKNNNWETVYNWDDKNISLDKLYIDNDNNIWSSLNPIYEQPSKLIAFFKDGKYITVYPYAKFLKDSFRAYDISFPDRNTVWICTSGWVFEFKK